MGFRFRKSINLGKHFRINLSKNGVGYSYGVKGYRRTISADGKKKDTYTLPGTGISYTSSPKSQYSSSRSQKSADLPHRSNNSGAYYFISFISLLIAIGCAFSRSIFGIVLFAILSFLFCVAGKKAKWAYEDYLEEIAEYEKEPEHPKIMERIESIPMLHEEKHKTENIPKKEKLIKTAKSHSVELMLSDFKRIRNSFIAFDVETTGLSPKDDRIVEIGAVRFSDGNVVDTFSTLVNPGIGIPSSATEVNHITNEMLYSAPSEQEVYPKLIEFLGEAIQGNILMCAHSASFDFNFLCNTFNRLGYECDIVYTDTLKLSKKYVSGLPNYKQSTLETHFGLINTASHRAASDAENCGHILLRLLECAEESNEDTEKKRIISVEHIKPTDEELEVCAYIQHLIAEHGGDISFLRYCRNSNNYVSVSCFYTFLKFRFNRKGKYIIISKDCSAVEKFVSEPCIQSEGGTDYVRVYFLSPTELESLSQYIFNAFLKSYKSMREYVSYGYISEHDIKGQSSPKYALSAEEMNTLLETAASREYVPVSISANTPTITKADVVINAVHSRIPLNEIKNQNDWNKGFEAGFSHWERAEKLRKEGGIEEAILLLDKARENGYNAPALYTSYAMAYHSLRDYENEIVVLDEAILRISEHKGTWEARQNKALKLLYDRQTAKRKAEEKAMKRSENEEKKKQAASAPKHSRGRSINQLDEAGNVIKAFDTVASAAQEIGISPKSIRDAANGVQKHAGGYRWAYKE